MSSSTCLASIPPDAKNTAAAHMYFIRVQHSLTMCRAKWFAVRTKSLGEQSILENKSLGLRRLCIIYLLQGGTVAEVDAEAGAADGSVDSWSHHEPAHLEGEPPGCHPIADPNPPASITKIQVILTCEASRQAGSVDSWCVTHLHIWMVGMMAALPPSVSSRIAQMSQELAKLGCFSDSSHHSGVNV